MTIDLERARGETPAVRNLIHFNNAGASLMPEPVVDSVVNHLRLESQIGGYEASNRELAKIEDTYSAIATLLNCQREEIAIVENATRAWDMLFYSLPFKAGDRILTAGSEYCSNYIAYLQVKKKYGVAVEIIPDDEYGQVCVDALTNMIDERVKLISVTHVPSAGGLVNPAKEIGKVANAAGIPYLLDACQSVGQMPVDVKEIGCDFLSSTGRKYLRGPRATGFLFVKAERLQSLEPPFLDIHAADWTSKDSYQTRADARRFENWETNYATKIGLGVAVRYALGWGLDRIQQRVVCLAESLRAKLSNLPGVFVTDQGVNKCGIVCFAAPEHDLRPVQKALLDKNVNVHVSSGEANRLGLDSRGIKEVIRASVHYFNDEREVDSFCQSLSAVLMESQRRRVTPC